MAHRQICDLRIRRRALQVVGSSWSDQGFNPLQAMEHLSTTSDSATDRPRSGWIARSLCASISTALTIHIVTRIIPGQAEMMADFGISSSDLMLPVPFEFLLLLSKTVDSFHRIVSVWGAWLMISLGFAWLCRSSRPAKGWIASAGCGAYEVATVTIACLLAVFALWTYRAIIVYLAISQLRLK